MRPEDRRRRYRRIVLLLSAVLIPAAVVVVLVVLVIRQDHELAERRASAERRDSLDQLRRELSARLQALRLEEVNRLIGEPARRVPHSPIVFVAPMIQDRMVLPWEDAAAAPALPHADVLRHQQQGEALEFQRGDAPAAVEAYVRAVSAARTTADACTARLSLGRARVKARMRAAAAQTDHRMLQECGEVVDGDGVPLALYAAERLVASGNGLAAASEYAIRSATVRQWHPPNEAYALQSLLRRLPGPTEPLRKLTAEIHDIEQIEGFARDAHLHLDRLRRAARSAPGDLAWVGYGDEPWLVTLVSPASFAAPVVIAVSARRIVPAGVGVVIKVAPTAASAPLGDGFVDLHAEWPPNRFAVAPSVSPAIHAAILIVVLGAALVSGYLLLRDVQREADTASMRSHFVASVSHELKTPLTSIRAHAETLLMGRTRGAETTSEYLQTIVSESERLARLVDSVLEFSRIEQGRKAYQMQVMRLEAVVRAAAATLEYSLAQMGFTLTISSDGSEPTLRGDPEALTQAVLNLVGNAMKYSGNARTIELRLGTRGREAYVDVVDYGIGISRDDQSRIFERFHRVRSPATAGIAGTGLGLALARHVVEAHHGRIDVVSDPGRGSTFSVLIPLQEQA